MSMKTVSYNNALYYLNGEKPLDEAYQKMFPKGKGRAVDEVDYFLAKRKHFAFHPRHLHDGYESLSWVYSFFCDLEVPTEKKVRGAMILTLQDNTGEGPENKYSIKAGGGSASDSTFVSSYSILVAHPTTGEDTWVVLMKKYSTVFSEVLISYEEIKALFDACASKEQKQERDAEYARDCVAYLLRGVQYGKVPVNSKENRTCDRAYITNFLKTNFPKATSDQWEEAIQFFEKRISEDLDSRFEENQPGRNVNEEHQQRTREKLKSLARVRDYIFPSTPPLHDGPAPVFAPEPQRMQLAMF